MSFIQKNLATNETVVYTTKMHWWVFRWGTFFCLLGILFLKASSTFGIIFILWGILQLVISYINFSSSEFVITNRRVILKTGFIKRRLVELQLNKAEGLAINQGLFGRMLNFGEALVTSGGVTNGFGPMTSPFGFKKQINEVIEEHVK